MSRDDYAFPCAGCLCDHCRYYDGDLKNKDMRCKQCENYIVTNEHAERLRKKIKVVKK